MSGRGGDGPSECTAWRKVSALISAFGFKRGTTAFVRVLHGASVAHRYFMRYYAADCKTGPPA
jgi:hypothetical protein